MNKTFEQIVLEGQASKCAAMEELFLLWQLMQQMEGEAIGQTCYAGIDPRSFHIDGIISEKDFGGALYILKETNMKKHIRKGQSLPVISDIRRDLARAESPGGEVEYLDYLAGMERILEKCEDGKVKELLKRIAVLYLNKRGGKGASDDIGMRYGQYYIAFIKRQIELIKPSVIVCCGEEIFRLIIMEVFQNKRRKKNSEEYMKWKDVVVNDVFLADSDYCHTKDEKKAAFRVVNMWSPAYRVNNGRYVSTEEYLKEFKRRVDNPEKNL